MIAWPQQVRRQQYVLRLEAAADHRADQIGSRLRGVGVGALGHFGGQHLMRLDIVEFQQASGAQRVRGRKDLRLGRCVWRDIRDGRGFRGKLQPDPCDQADPANTEHNGRHQGSAKGHAGLAKSNGDIEGQQYAGGDGAGIGQR
jgi:hypothetical protein